MIEVLNASSGRTTASSDKFPRSVIPGTYDFGFAGTLMAKDVALYLEAAAADGAPRQVAECIAEVWNRFTAAHPDADFTFIHKDFANRAVGMRQVNGWGSARGIDVEAGDPALQARPGRRVAVEDRGIMPGDDVVAGRRQLLEGCVALEDVADVVDEREDAALLDMGVEVGRVGGQHDVAPPRAHPHALQAPRVTADAVDADARRHLLRSVVEDHAAGEDLAHHRHHVFDLEGPADHLVTHAAPGGVRHLAVLQVVSRARKEVVVAGVVVVQVGDDDVLDLARIDADRLQPGA